jgi:hypothetical protein
MDTLSIDMQSSVVPPLGDSRAFCTTREIPQPSQLDQTSPVNLLAAYDLDVNVSDSEENVRSSLGVRHPKTVLENKVNKWKLCHDRMRLHRNAGDNVSARLWRSYGTTSTPIPAANQCSGTPIEDSRLLFLEESN